MAELAPVLELLIVPEGEGARVYVADWCSPATRAGLDAQKSAALPAMPNLAELHGFMWASDAPYRATVSKGKAELVARGRSAIVLDGWIFEQLGPA